MTEKLSLQFMIISKILQLQSATGDSVESIRADDRLTIGGRLAHGVEKKGSVDGSVWGDWKTTELDDKWHLFKDGTNSVDVLTLNKGVIEVQGGRLATDSTWNAGFVHVVRHWVVVPKDVTLIIAPGACVKFTPGSGLLIEDGGKLVANGESGKDVVFTHIADDSVGGDIDLQDGTIEEGEYTIQKAPSGIIQENGFFQTRHIKMAYTFPSLSIHDLTNEEKSGKVFVPVTPLENVKTRLVWIGRLLAIV